LSKSDFLVPFLAGLGFGAVAALLPAPEAGRNTRQRVSDIARWTADAIQAQAENVGDAAEDLIQQSRSTWTRQENEGAKR
jgi:gas vesicle protein